MSKNICTFLELAINFAHWKCYLLTWIQLLYVKIGIHIGLHMIDDELLNNGQSSPPPPAPNGENSTEIFQPTITQSIQFQDASWNPFCTPNIQQQDTHQQLSSMNPFAADLMKQEV